jgi:hypothetical protein
MTSACAAGNSPQWGSIGPNTACCPCAVAHSRPRQRRPSLSAPPPQTRQTALVAFVPGQDLRAWLSLRHSGTCYAKGARRPRASTFRCTRKIPTDMFCMARCNSWRKVCSSRRWVLLGLMRRAPRAIAHQPVRKSSGSPPLPALAPPMRRLRPQNSVHPATAARACSRR